MNAGSGLLAWHDGQHEAHLIMILSRANIILELYEQPTSRWEVEYTDEFEDWWNGLDAAVQDSIAVYVTLLEERGVGLRHPYSSGVHASRHSHMRELRIQREGRPYRVFYAFDPRRVAILLVGGCKAGDDRFYERMVPIADRLYDEHLEEIV